MNETNKVTLVQIGLFYSALICADMTSKIHSVNNPDYYSEGTISSGTLTYRVLSGCQMQFNNVIQLVRHRIFWVKKKSPLVYITIRESNDKLDCGLGT